METVEQQALDACDSEPIHIPGAIQAFGCLIACAKNSTDIAAISANSGEFLGVDAKASIGQSLATFLDAGTLHSLGNKLAYSTIENHREFVATITGANDTSLDIFVHSGPKYDYLELVPTSSIDRAVQDRIAAITNGMQKLGKLEDLYDLAISNVQAICGYDRVMFYRFLPDDSGEVVAEVRSGHMEPFLGLRYPAWDIPKQARKLYATTPIRAIENSNEEAVDLCFADGLSAKDFDLSTAVLRATSPIHCEYLRNMGVASTMTIPVVVERKLWGLIACHNDKPHTPKMSVLDAAEVIGHIVSFSVSQLRQKNTVSFSRSAAHIRDSFIALQTRLDTPQDFAESLAKFAGEHLEFEGVGVQVGDQWRSWGTAPSSFDPAAHNAMVSGSPLGDILFSDDAGAEPVRGEETFAGFLSIPITARPLTRLVFFRPPVRKKVNWGGFPDKDIEEAETNPRLSPRKSFAKYVEQSGGRSEEWSNQNLAFASNLQRECAASQSAAGTIMQQKDSLRILADELNHRVKNILALVKSLSSHARESSASPEDYAASLESRLFSLAASHDMLTRADMEGVAFSDVVTMELEPYLSADELEKALNGPAIVLTPDAIPMTTLLFHELASNAAKHGALSDAGGKITVDWAIAGDKLEIFWRERGGPEVKPPTRKGFGMELLCEAIPFEFSGAADIEFAKEGLNAKFLLPLREILKLGEASALVETGGRKSAEKRSVKQLKRGLVVEDSYLLASEHSQILKRIGFADVDITANVRSAIACLEQHEYQFALLDINLRDEMSFAVADALVDADIPFVFVSGYGSSVDMPQKFHQIAVLNKPLEPAAVALTLAR